MSVAKLVVVVVAAVVFVVIPAVMLYWRLAKVPTMRGVRGIALKAFAVGLIGCLGTCRWLDTAAAAAPVEPAAAFAAPIEPCLARSC